MPYGSGVTGNHLDPADEVHNGRLDLQQGQAHTDTLAGAKTEGQDLEKGITVVIKPVERKTILTIRWKGSSSCGRGVVAIVLLLLVVVVAAAAAAAAVGVVVVVVVAAAVEVE